MAHGREARPCYHEHDMLIDNMLISYLLSRPPSLILEYKVAWPRLVASANSRRRILRRRRNCQALARPFREAGCARSPGPSPEEPREVARARDRAGD